LHGGQPANRRLDLALVGSPEPCPESLRADDEPPDRREAHGHCSTFVPEMVEDAVDKLLRRYPESPIIEHMLGALADIAQELP
jgi:hypothetical protein